MAWNDPITDGTDLFSVDFLNQFASAIRERAAICNSNMNPVAVVARIATIEAGDDITQCNSGAVPFTTSYMAQTAPSAVQMRRVIHLQQMTDWISNWYWMTATELAAAQTRDWSASGQAVYWLSRADVYAQAGLPRPFSATTVPFTRRFPKELSSLTPVAESFIEPVADTNTAWAPTGAATRWGAVDDGASPNLSDYLTASTSSEQQLRHGASGTLANRLVLKVYAASTSGTPTLSGRLQTAQGWTSTQALASGAFSAGWYTATWDGGWTQADLAALLSGLSLSGSGGARIYTVRVQVLPQYDGEVARSLGDGQTYQYNATGNTWQPCDPQVPPTTLSAQGFLQPGDYIGPWIFTELRAMLNAMLIRYMGFGGRAHYHHGQPSSGTTWDEKMASAEANAIASDQTTNNSSNAGASWYFDGGVLEVRWTANGICSLYLAAPAYGGLAADAGLPGMEGLQCKVVVYATAYSVSAGMTSIWDDQGWGWTKKVNQLWDTITLDADGRGSTAFNLPDEPPNRPTDLTFYQHRGIGFQFLYLADGRTKFAYQP
jgi:hypothetical protein